MDTIDLHPVLDKRGSFEAMKLGRVEKKHDPRTLRLASYIDDAVLLPEIPATYDFTAAVPAYPMFGNDRLGDCTIAGIAHMIQTWAAAFGTILTLDEATVLAAYIPGTGTDDTGRFEVDVLNYMRQTGIEGHTVGAYAYVDAQNLDHVRAAIYLFGGVYTGIALPQTAQNQAVWDVVGDGKTGPSQPGSWGGHCVPYEAFGGGCFRCVTWAHVLALTEAFHLAYCDELYAVISTDFLNEGKTPAGFDLAALQADLASLGDAQNAAPAATSAPESATGHPGGHPDGTEPGGDPGDASPEDSNAATRDAHDEPNIQPGSGYYWNG